MPASSPSLCLSLCDSRSIPYSFCNILIMTTICILVGFSGGTSGKESACQCGRHQKRFQSLGEEDPLEEGMATHSSILAWRVPWTKKSLAGNSSKSQTRLNDYNNNLYTCMTIHVICIILNALVVSCKFRNLDSNCLMIMTLITMFLMEK